MDVYAFKDGVYALLRCINEVELEVEEAERASRDHERGLSVPKSERLTHRIVEALHEVTDLERAQGFDLFVASEPDLAAKMGRLTERFTSVKEVVARLSP
jgi:hypothetical protein